MLGFMIIAMILRRPLAPFLAKPLYRMIHPSPCDTIIHPPQHVTLKKKYAMKLGLVACIALSATAGCNAFTGGPVTGAVSLRQKKVDAVAKVMAAASPRPGLDGTRRDVIQTASAAVAGLLSSAVLPAGVLAAAKAEPNRRGVFGSLQGTAQVVAVFMFLHARCAAGTHHRSVATAAAMRLKAELEKAWRGFLVLDIL